MGFLPEGFEKEKNDDKEVGFAPIKGKYKARIDRLERVRGTSEKTGNEYDFYSLSAQIYETYEGTKGNNRYMKKTYSNTDSEYSTAEENRAKLLNDMYTAGYDLDTGSEGDSDEVRVKKMEASFESVLGGDIFLNCWVRKSNGQEYQSVKVIPEITGKTPVSSEAKLPF